MTRSWVLLALSFVAFAATAAAAPGTSCPYPPRVTSYSEAYAGSSLDSGTQIGDPATSSILKGYADPGGGYNFEADSGLTIGTQYFASISHLGGHTTSSPSGADAFSVGEVTDCPTFGGTQGGARAHIPIELSGSTSVIWSSTRGHVSQNIFDPAYARIMITCAAYAYGTSTLSNCNDPDFIYDTTAPATIDTTAELVFNFSFGDPITIQFIPRVTAGFSYAAADGGFGGSDGHSSGAGPAAADLRDGLQRKPDARRDGLRDVGLRLSASRSGAWRGRCRLRRGDRNRRTPVSL